VILFISYASFRFHAIVFNYKLNSLGVAFSFVLKKFSYEIFYEVWFEQSRRNNLFLIIHTCKRIQNLDLSSHIK